MVDCPDPFVVSEMLCVDEISFYKKDVSILNSHKCVSILVYPGLPH